MPRHSDFIDELTEISELPFDERQRAEREFRSQIRSRDILENYADLGLSARRSAVELCRDFLADESIRDFLLDLATTEPDIKIRRRALTLLGRSGSATLIPALVSALNRESHRAIQSSYVLALGDLGFTDWSSLPEGLPAEPLRLAQAKTFVPTSEPAAPNAPPAGRYRIRCYAGLEELLVAEAAQLGISLVVAREDSGCFGDIKPPELLAKLRLALAYECYEEIQAPSDVAAMKILRRRLATLGNGNELRFRLKVPPCPSRAIAKRWIHDLSRALEQDSNLRNNPSNYDLAVDFIGSHGDRHRIAWRHMGWPGARPQGREVIRVSLHPTIAAAMFVLAPPLPGARSLDPCAGAGTIAAEGLRTIPQATFVSCDYDYATLLKAQRNLPPGAPIIVADAAELPFPDASFGHLYCNPPFGIKTDDRTLSTTLPRNLIREAERLLTPQGTFILYAPYNSAFHRELERSEFFNIERSLSLSAGGLAIELTLARRR